MTTSLIKTEEMCAHTPVYAYSLTDSVEPWKPQQDSQTVSPILIVTYRFFPLCSSSSLNQSQLQANKRQSSAHHQAAAGQQPSGWIPTTFHARNTQPAPQLQLLLAPQQHQAPKPQTGKLSRTSSQQQQAQESQQESQQQEQHRQRQPQGTGLSQRQQDRHPKHSDGQLSLPSFWGFDATAFDPHLTDTGLLLQQQQQLHLQKMMQLQQRQALQLQHDAQHEQLLRQLQSMSNSQQQALHVQTLNGRR